MWLIDPISPRVAHVIHHLLLMVFADLFPKRDSLYHDFIRAVSAAEITSIAKIQKSYIFYHAYSLTYSSETVCTSVTPVRVHLRGHARYRRLHTIFVRHDPEKPMFTESCCFGNSSHPNDLLNHEIYHDWPIRGILHQSSDCR